MVWKARSRHRSNRSNPGRSERTLNPNPEHQSGPGRARAETRACHDVREGARRCVRISRALRVVFQVSLMQSARAWTSRTFSPDSATRLLYICIVIVVSFLPVLLSIIIIITIITIMEGYNKQHSIDRLFEVSKTGMRGWVDGWMGGS